MTLLRNRVHLRQRHRLHDAVDDSVGGNLVGQRVVGQHQAVPQYVGVHLLAEAIDAAGSTDPAAVLAELPNVAFEGPSGPVQINKQHHAELNYYLGEVKQDGTTEVVADFGLVDPGEQCPELQSAP